MPTRREALGALAAPLLGGMPSARATPALRALFATPGAPQAIARDEDFWREVQRAFPCDRTLSNLNNGGVSPSPAVALDAQRRHLAASNEAPAWSMWRVLEPRKEIVRERLAREWGVDPESVALVRNASEGLQICQFGFDLEPGDEVLTSTQDYPRMRNTFRQRERREGVVLREVRLPGPEAEDALVVEAFRAALSERTRLMLVCHVINLNGRVLPVRELCALGREHGVPVVVDGAHAFAHLPFRLDELGCDYYATSLHKWLAAPHGTGLLYVARERIPGLWPLMAAEEEQDADIRKFEEIGTHPAAQTLAIAEALDFHLGLGHERKYARLVHLRDRWARRLAANPRTRLHTSLEPGRAGAIALVEFEGLDTTALRQWLWREHRILLTQITHDELNGLRVSPSVYTSVEEIDRFAERIEHALAHGIPG